MRAGARARIHQPAVKISQNNGRASRQQRLNAFLPAILQPCEVRRHPDANARQQPTNMFPFPSINEAPAVRLKGEHQRWDPWLNVRDSTMGKRDSMSRPGIG